MPISSRRAVLSASDYIDRVLNTGPIAYFPFNETAGTVAHSAISSAQNGTYSSDVSTWPVGAGIGDGNSAPIFDGVNDYINIATAALIAAFNTDELSWMFWIKATAAINWSDATRVPLTLTTDANNFTKFSSFANPNVQPRYKGGGVEDNVTIVEASTAWRQYGLSVSKTADQLKAYRDGAQQGATQGTLGNWVGALATALVGADSAVPANPWAGQIQHVVIWGRAVGAGVFSDLYRV